MATQDISVWDENQTKAVDVITDVTSKNRLAVDAISTPSVVPSDRPMYKYVQLLNGASKAMNVNGSVTPVNFDFTPAAGETWFVEATAMLIRAQGTPDPNEFGNVGAALTNGLQILIRSNGTEYEVSNIKDNQEITSFWGDSPFGSSIASGWLNDTDTFTGTKKFEYPMKLTQNTGDYIRVKVRDNLTTINFLNIGVFLFKVI